MSSPIVEVKEGKLKGKVCFTVNNNVQYYAFKGIPYAKPPVGELRFAIPEPPVPWQGVRDATENCNICAQFDKDTNDYKGDEDCLFLNVYTPKILEAKSLLPVMVYVHGGGFLFGNGTDDCAHGPDLLIEKDVVVIGFNYRVGILGFLSLDCKDAPGNMGLRDQVQALKWIQNNISMFGGDPNNVTLLGFSAGAASVEYLMLSPMAKGLFHKAIAHSGSSLLPWARNDRVKDLASKIPVINGINISSDKELLNYLKNMPIKELIISSIASLAAKKDKPNLDFGYVPIIENPVDWEPFLSESSLKLLSRGEFNKVPLITGFCDRDGLLMAIHSPASLENLTKDKKFLDYFPLDLENSVKIEIEDKLKAIYMENDKRYQDDDAFAIDFFTDVHFFGGIYVAAKLMAKFNSPVYFYEFAYDGKLNYLKQKFSLERKGACHGDDAGYIMTTAILNKKLNNTDKEVRDRMVKMWTNFAKHGEPTTVVDNSITTKWQPIEETQFNYLLIDDKLTMKCLPYPERAKIMEELFVKFHKK